MYVTVLVNLESEGTSVFIEDFDPDQPEQDWVYLYLSEGCWFLCERG